MHRLKSLLQRAYRLQGEFEGVLGGTSEPSSNGSSQGRFLSTTYITNNYIVDEYLTCLSDILSQEEQDDACLRDSISIASTDSFVSAAEVRKSPHLFNIS